MGADRDTDPTDPVAEMFVARGLQPVEPEHRHVNLMLADIVAKGIRDAAEVNRTALQAQRFPLDAEQIVRLAAGIAAEFLDANRSPDTRPADRDALAIRLGGLAGVPMSVLKNEWGGRRLAPINADFCSVGRDRDGEVR